MPDRTTIPMQATVRLKPLRRPNFILIDSDGDGEAKVPVSELDGATIDALVEQLRGELYAVSGAERPTQAAHRCSKCGEFE